MEPAEVIEEIGKLEQRLNELRATMAQRLVRESVPKEEFSLFVCRIRNERVGLPIESVEEVLPMCKLASLPEAPPWLAGLLNLRGSMIPVIDALARIERRERSPELRDFLVICSSEERRFGLIVQEVFQIENVDGSLIQPVDRELPQAPYVLGLFQIDGKAVFQLSLSCLLNTSSIPEDAW
ncbi:MAG: purine-binding chemotaxis protein CheW [Deltaproteobacteria bacterium]|nr:purine-binding chemotaxis protein CheW [Deltaproteobacteria bacterium]